MNTFDTSSFIHKAMSDLGGIGVGKLGAVNLIPSIPGMGIVSSIQAECQTLEQQAPIKTVMVTMEQIEGDGLALGRPPAVDIGDAQVVVVDAGPANMTPAQQQALVEFIEQSRKGASVWVVGGNTAELDKAFDGGVSKFQNTLRSFRDNGQADPAVVRKPAL